jgi:hypothetical protein
VFVPADHAVALHRQLPDARLLIAPDSGHQVMVQRPGLFNDAAAAFYRSTEPTARERATAGAARRRIPAGLAAHAGAAAMVLDPVVADAAAADGPRDGESGPDGDGRSEAERPREREWFDSW